MDILKGLRIKLNTILKFLYSKILKYNLAYTLAELIIVIGIIGILAAITIPIVKQEKTNKEFKVRCLKMKILIIDAFEETEQYVEEDFSKRNIESFKKAFESQFKTVKCSDNKVNKVCIVDGSEFEYGEYNSTCPDGVCMQITVDTNGAKDPNTIGKDKFTFNITKTKGIVPVEDPKYCNFD